MSRCAPLCNDHSAFSRARHERFGESDVFRRVFERVVDACIAAGLVGGEGFAVDASLIVADANKQRSVRGARWNRAEDEQRRGVSTRQLSSSFGER
jgi:transposase